MLLTSCLVSAMISFVGVCYRLCVLYRRPGLALDATLPQPTSYKVVGVVNSIAQWSMLGFCGGIAITITTGWLVALAVFGGYMLAVGSALWVYAEAFRIKMTRMAEEIMEERGGDCTEEELKDLLLEACKQAELDTEVSATVVE